jgi:membrane protein DedA with SNARE-associated domain
LPDLGTAITAWLSRLDDGAVGPVALFVLLSAAIEHLFPPYPGDLAVAFGAAVTTARQWWLGGMFLAAMAGSVGGSAATFYAGRWLAARPEGAYGPRVERLRVAVRAGVRVLEQRGVVAIVLSRFVPVGRAVVIVAAGYAQMAPGRALLAATAGALLWNAALFAVGAAVGAQYTRIAAVLSAYSRVAYGLMALAVVVWLVRRWRRRAATPPPP